MNDAQVLDRISESVDQEIKSWQKYSFVVGDPPNDDLKSYYFRKGIASYANNIKETLKKRPE
jgi:hypothetical protein